MRDKRAAENDAGPGGDEMSRQKQWWGYVKAVVRDYPEYERRLEQIKAGSITPNYNATGGSSGASRKTELIALRELPGKEQKKYEAVHEALQQTSRRSSGRWRCRMIELVYFRKSHTLQGAALECHISWATARLWHREFIDLVAKRMEAKGIL